MTTAAKFMERVDVQENGCWLWTGSTLADGYGQIRHEGDTRAHRVAHVLFIGPIPEGLVVDHLCGVKLCVRPDHLEAVTQAENVRRSKAHITHCPKGHPYDGPNLYVRPGSQTRSCRACSRIAGRRATARKNAARLAALDELRGVVFGAA